MKILLSTRPTTYDAYASALPMALKKHGIHAEIRADHAPELVDYIVYEPNDALTDFAPFVRTKAVLSLWAGVERLVGNPTLTLPLTRMVDEGLRLGMRDYVVAHVMRHHVGLDAHVHGLHGDWQQVYPPLARDRTVTVLGLGELGRTCADALSGLGFQTLGWSRTAKSVTGVECYCGPQGLDDALARSEIVVLLLPNTPETANTLSSRTLALMPRGAVVINPGRGTLIDDDALLDALESGHIGHATLDVFRHEPLPTDHPYWTHPGVTVTPHVAAATRPVTASDVIAENIRRSEVGEPMLYQVDATRGY